MENRKKDNTRIVTFKEDYKIKGGKIVYAKGSEHAIHKVNVEKLEAKGVKMDVKTYAEAQKANKAKASENPKKGK